MKLFKPAFKIGAFVMLMWGGAMLLPALISLTHWDECIDYIMAAACCYVLAAVLFKLGQGNLSHLQPRSLFMVTAFNWLLLSVTGTLPYMFSDINISFTDSLFESISGITTTGASIFSNVESLPVGILLWRSLTQWIGGIGIILVAVAILPSLKIGGMRLFRSEFSEWSQLETGRISKIATHIVYVYLAISLTCFLSYRFFGMTWFDAANHMMATVSTGGFSTWNDSFAHYHSGHLQAVSSLFMMLGAFPFLIVMLSLENRNLMLFRDRQVQHLVALILASALLISVWRYFRANVETFEQIVESSVFNIVSIITTTGFASEDYSLWGSFPIMVMSFLMFSGGCSGSTAGGVKLFRYHLLFIFMREHMYSALHPGVTVSRQYNDHAIRDDVLVASLAFFFFVIASLSVSASLLAAAGLDPITSITGSLSALMNVGPGFGDIIGPAGNYSSLPDFTKYILGLDMLLGRLEYLTLIIIFTREFWKW